MTDIQTLETQAEAARVELRAKQLQTPMAFAADDHKVKTSRAHASATRARNRLAKKVNVQTAMFADDAETTGKVSQSSTAQLSLF